QVKEKVYSIEQIDSQVIKPVFEYLENCGEDYAILVLPDHPTPIQIRTHSAEPVPFALYRKGDSAGRTARYTESEAKAVKSDKVTISSFERSFMFNKPHNIEV
ncbi:MAG: hypothetical protein CVU52_06235, partial [Deltaproteobacteria bacterium HGW-Deltaproteobacteria-10]